MNIVLWLAQLILAGVFLMAGIPKLTTSIAEIATKVPAMASLSEPLLRFIGVSEVAGAIGVILPAATRILPHLTPLAAAGLATIMLLAFGFQVSHGEYATLWVNVCLGALALFVYWGRTKKVPIAPRA